VNGEGVDEAVGADGRHKLDPEFPEDIRAGIAEGVDMGFELVACLINQAEADDEVADAGGVILGLYGAGDYEGQKNEFDKDPMGLEPLYLHDNAEV